jgi:DMSO/TMAO reductase YedYZ molybdopterin-dependent catalytic subunit
VEPFSQIELQLAARNHGMPLEALRYPVTPVGLHYLLTHYDIPAVDPASFELAVGGRVARPLTLRLDDLRARPAVELEVTMECAGNGRAMLSPRPVSQPWLNEAVGTAAWRGTPLAPLVAEAEARRAEGRDQASGTRDQAAPQSPPDLPAAAGSEPG